MTPRIRSPSAQALERRFKTTTPHPSLRTKPSADPSKETHRPSGDIMCAFDRAIVVSGMRIRLTPPASARSAFAGSQTLTGQVHCHQGAGTSRIERHARALQVKEVGDSAGSNTVCVARSHIRVNETPAALELH